MKTQEEYAYKIGEIVLRMWKAARVTGSLLIRKYLCFLKTGTRHLFWEPGRPGCDLIILGGTNCNEGSMVGFLGSLGNENFYICQPLSFQKSSQEIEKVNPLYAFKLATAYFRGQGMVPVFEDCSLQTGETMSIEVIRYRLPVYWACALINDDYSGLSEEEIREINAFLRNAEGYAVDVDWETQGFYHCNDAGTLPGECADFIFHKI